MNKNKTVRFAVFAAAVLAALPLCAAELTHRWSFNGVWSDSAVVAFIATPRLSIIT